MWRKVITRPSGSALSAPLPELPRRSAAAYSSRRKKSQSSPRPNSAPPPTSDAVRAFPCRAPRNQLASRWLVAVATPGYAVVLRSKHAQHRGTVHAGKYTELRCRGGSQTDSLETHRWRRGQDDGKPAHLRWCGWWSRGHAGQDKGFCLRTSFPSRFAVPVVVERGDAVSHFSHGRRRGPLYRP